MGARGIYFLACVYPYGPFIFVKYYLNYHFFLCSYIYGKDIPATPLSLFLFNVGKWQDTVWEERKRFLSPYIPFEEKFIGEVFGMGEVEVRYTGSFRVGLQSLGMTGSDNDMMYIYKSIRVNTTQKASSTDHLTIKSSDQPGHVYLRVNVPKSVFVQLYHRIALNVQADNFGFPSPGEVDKILDESGLQNLQEGPCEFFLSSEVFTELHSRFNYFRFGGWVTFQQSGPASTVRWNISTLPNYVNLGPLDNVFALHCPSWPEEASSWLKRERKFGFPRDDVVKKMLDYGVDLVPKPRKMEHPSSYQRRKTFMWRLSFSVPELLLVSSWNEAQRICYRYAKTLMKTNLKHLDIPSYCGLNVMLWLIEQTDPAHWVDHHLVFSLQMFFKNLERCCLDGFCSHYFIPENNLFIDISQDKLLKGSQTCRDISQNLYVHLWLDEGIWCYLSGLRQTTWHSFNSASTLCKMCDENILTEFLERWSQALSDLQRSCERNFRIYYCLKVYRELARAWYASEQYPQRREFILKAVRTFLHDSRKRQQTAEEKFIADSVCFANLRCLRAYFHEVTSVSEWRFFYRKELIQLQQDLFHRKDFQGSVNLALHYYFHGNFEAAARVLESDSLTDETDNSAQSIPVFSPFDKSSADPFISEFPFKGHAFYCPEIVVRWYLLWKCYLLMDRNDTERAALAQRKLRELDLCNLYQENLRIMKPLFEPFGRYLKDLAIRHKDRS